MGQLEYRDYLGRTYLSHSAKGSSWKKHKYVKVVDGKYFYPPSYEGGRTIDGPVAKAKGLISGKKEDEKKTELDLNKVYESSGGLKKKEDVKDEKKQTDKKEVSATTADTKKEEEKTGKKSGSGSSSKSTKKKTIDLKEKEKDHVVKAPVDSKNTRAVLSRINSSTGRKASTGPKASAGKKASSSSKTKEESEEKLESLAEDLVNDLQDAKDNLADRKAELKNATTKEEKEEIRALIAEAQKDLTTVRSNLNKKAKNTKGLRKIINSMTSS